VSGINIILGVASLGFVVVTFVLSRSGMLPVEAAAARMCGYALTAVLALVGVPVLLAVIPALIGVAIGYVVVARSTRRGGSGRPPAG
jgi:hypothetical protein